MSDEPSIRQQVTKLVTDMTVDKSLSEEFLIDKLIELIRTRQLDLVDQFRDHIEGAYEAVEMAMGEAYYQITQADKKDAK